MAYFVGNFLGPQFEKDSIDTEIIFGTINRDNPEFTRIALNDAKASRYFKGAGFQWDGKGAIPYISKDDAYRGRMWQRQQRLVGSREHVVAD